MTNQPQPSPSFAALRCRRYRDRKRNGVRIVPIEVSTRVIKALADRGLVSSANPDIATSIKLLLTVFAVGIASVNKAQLAAVAKAAGVAAPTQHASPTPPV